MPNRARILIATSGLLCRNPRALKEASTLAADFDVTVLAFRNHSASMSDENNLVRSAAFQIRYIDLVGGSETGAGRLLVRRMQTWLARKASALFGAQNIEALGPARALLALARSHPAELTIVHNEVPHWVGLHLLAAGRCVAADIEDWHSEDLLPNDRRNRPLDLIRRNERTLLHDAAYTTTTSHALADALHIRFGGARPHVITNSFPLQADPRHGPPGNPPTFFWCSQTVGPGRGLEPFLAAWAMMEQPSRIVLLGEILTAYRNELLSPVPEAKRNQITFHPLVSPAQLPSIVAQYDIGLALEESSILSRDLTITNKILQYMNAGLAIVASDTAGQREVLAHDPKAGLLVSLADPSRLARQLDALLVDRAVLKSRQGAAQRLAAGTYCWEHEAPRVVELVQSALAGKINRTPEARSTDASSPKPVR